MVWFHIAFSMECVLLIKKASEKSDGDLKVVYESKQFLDAANEERKTLEEALVATKTALDLAKKKYLMESAALKVMYW